MSLKVMSTIIHVYRATQRFCQLQLHTRIDEFGSWNRIETFPLQEKLSTILKDARFL